jgi:hypothetical protein
VPALDASISLKIGAGVPTIRRAQFQSASWAKAVGALPFIVSLN